MTRSTPELPAVRETERTGEPLHVFEEDSGAGVKLHVYVDHLELHSPDESSASFPRRCGSSTD